MPNQRRDLAEHQGGCTGGAWLRAFAVLALIGSGCARPVGPPVACSPTLEAGLPDALARSDGGCVTSPDQWPERRAELLELFAKHVYGRAPGAPQQLELTVLEEDPGAMGGAATLRRVAIKSHQAGREHTFELIRFAPNTGRPVGVFLVLNTRPPSHTDPTRAIRSEFWPAEDVVARGYAIAAIQADALAPDDRDTWASGVISLYEGDAGVKRAHDAWKTIAAWSWGLSRAMDYLQTDPLVDASRVAVVGHSRGGKAALWAGAQDPRFSLTIANDSGHAGAALSRRRVGETVNLLNGVFPYWFADNFNRYNQLMGTPDYLQQDVARYTALTAADVQRAARTYLGRNKVVLTVVPMGKADLMVKGGAR